MAKSKERQEFIEELRKLRQRRLESEELQREAEELVASLPEFVDPDEGPSKTAVMIARPRAKGKADSEESD